MSVDDVDPALLARMADEFARCESPIELVLRPVVALQLAALLQVALKHPAIDGTNGDAAWQAAIFVEHVRGYFRDHDADAILEVLRRGDAR